MELTQYFIRQVFKKLISSKTFFTVRSSRMDAGISNTTVEVTIFLGRRLVNSIMTVYMPTILLNIIGHSTNFFKPESFDAGAAVNLMVK